MTAEGGKRGSGTNHSRAGRHHRPGCRCHRQCGQQYLAGWWRRGRCDSPRGGAGTGQGMHGARRLRDRHGQSHRGLPAAGSPRHPHGRPEVLGIPRRGRACACPLPRVVHGCGSRSRSDKHRLSRHLLRGVRLGSSQRCTDRDAGRSRIAATGAGSARGDVCVVQRRGLRRLSTSLRRGVTPSHPREQRECDESPCPCSPP